MPPINTYRLKRELTKLGQAAILVAAILIMLELLLRFVDPWGLRYFNDLLTIGNQYFEPHPERDYVIADGNYRLSYWRVGIDDGTRVIPSTNTEADCDIVLLGDSVIFGYGVNDNETVAYYLAQNFPDVHFINTGMVAYNSSNVLANYEAFPNADAYLYLIIGNDYDPPIATEGEVFVSSGNERLPQLVRYVNFAIYRGENNVNLVDDPHTRLAQDVGMLRLLDEVDTMASDERVTLVTFDFYNTMINLIEERGHEVYEVSYPPQTISIVDAHLNPQGNQALAEQLTPIVEDMVSNTCN